MDPIAILAIFFGALLCFFGYPMIHSAIRVWGFFVGGLFAVALAINVFHIPGGLNQLTLQMGLAFAMGGILGAVAAGPLSVLIIFLTGVALGWLMGGFVYTYFVHQENTLLAVSLALATGLLSIRFQEIVLIISTAFVGAAVFIYGARILMPLDMVWLVLIFFLSLFFGAAAQYKSVNPESSLLKF